MRPAVAVATPARAAKLAAVAAALWTSHATHHWVAHHWITHAAHHWSPHTAHHRRVHRHLRAIGRHGPVRPIGIRNGGAVARSTRHRPHGCHGRVGRRRHPLRPAGRADHRRGQERQHGQSPRPSHVHRTVSAASKVACQACCGIHVATALAFRREYLRRAPADGGQAGRQQQRARLSAVSLDNTYRRGITAKTSTFDTNGNFSGSGSVAVVYRAYQASRIEAGTGAIPFEYGSANFSPENSCGGRA
jgi:hypothetical protein